MINTKNTYIPQEDLEKIRSKLHGTDLLITDLLLATGFRLDDIMNSRIYQLAGDSVSLLERKTQKRRSVPLPPELAERVKTYVKKRHRFSFTFPALRRYGKKKMHRTTYWRHFMIAVRRADCADRGYSPHSLRKVYAVRALSKTGDLLAVQKDLNHSHLTTTLLYALSDRIQRSEG